MGLCIPVGIFQIEVFVLYGERGGSGLNFPGIPLFLGVFTRRCGIGGGCGVRLRILTRISLFWAMYNQGDHANKVVFSERG